MKHLIIIFCVIATIGLVLPANAQSDKRRGFSLQEVVRKTMQHVDIDESLYPDVKLNSDQKGVKIIQHRPNGNSRLEYDLIIPNLFEREVETVYNRTGSGGIMITDNLFSRMARYIGPAVIDHSPVIELQVRKLEYEVSAENYIENYLERVALTTLKIEGVKNGKEARTIHIGLEDGRPEVIFSRAVIHGDLIFYVTFSIPVKGVEGYAPIAPKILDSFIPIAKATGQIEPRETQKLLNVISFTYPTSWQLKNRRIGSTFEVGADLFNYDVTGRMDGFIKVESHRKTFGKKPSEELKNIIQDFEEVGLFVSKKIRNFKVPDYDQDLRFSRGEVYLMTYEQLDKTDELVSLGKLRSMGGKFIDHELWLLVADSGKFIHYVLLLTPTEEGFPDIWSRNRLAFKIVIRSLNFRP
jgi:hypothetical protein